MPTLSQLSRRQRWGYRIGLWLAGRRNEVAYRSVYEQSLHDDSIFDLTSDHNLSQLQSSKNYRNALTAWRTSPMARNIVNNTTSSVVGDEFRLSAPSDADLDEFREAFWFHRKNQVDNNIHAWCDELERAGTLLLCLHVNSFNGMSYVREITKDNIVGVVTLQTDWKTIIELHEQRPTDNEPRVWITQDHPHIERYFDNPKFVPRTLIQDDKPYEGYYHPMGDIVITSDYRSRQVMRNTVVQIYNINRVVGAFFGEGSLDPIIKWIQMYETMMKNRFRLNIAMMYVHFVLKVTKPNDKVRVGKKMKTRLEVLEAKYSKPPPPGSLLILTDHEEFEAVTPKINANDAAPDAMAIKNMISIGGNQPPAWQGEQGANLSADATVMSAPTERHLRRKRKYFVWAMSDLVLTAYYLSGGKVDSVNPHKLLKPHLQDLNLSDNKSLAEAGRYIALILRDLSGKPLHQIPYPLMEKLYGMLFRFTNEPLESAEIRAICDETVRIGQEIERKEREHEIATKPPTVQK